MCDEKLIWDYIDNELSESKRLEVEQHLSTCPACKQEFDLCVALHQEIQKVECLKPSFRFSKNVMEIIELDVSCQYRPLLNSFWKRLLMGGMATTLFFVTLITLILPGVWRMPAPQNSSFLRWIENPGFYTFVTVMISFWLIYLADQWLQKRFSVK
ncbi:MAG: zf-HC2 domain-containing protein [Bacteroidota bacterium]